MLTLRILLRDLSGLLVFSAGITAVVLFLPPEHALPWAILLLGLFLGLRNLVRIEKALSEEYRESLANRQAIGWVYAVILLVGMAVGVGGTWWLRQDGRGLGLASTEQAALMDRWGSRLAGSMDALAGRIEALQSEMSAMREDVQVLAARASAASYNGPAAEEVQALASLGSRELVSLRTVLERIEQLLQAHGEKPK